VPRELAWTNKHNKRTTHEREYTRVEATTYLNEMWTNVSLQLLAGAEKDSSLSTSSGWLIA
jgi:hypothetical protein